MHNVEARLRRLETIQVRSRPQTADERMMWLLGQTPETYPAWAAECDLLRSIGTFRDAYFVVPDASIETVNAALDWWDSLRSVPIVSEWESYWRSAVPGVVCRREHPMERWADALRLTLAGCSDDPIQALMAHDRQPCVRILPFYGVAKRLLIEYTERAEQLQQIDALWSYDLWYRCGGYGHEIEEAAEKERLERLRIDAERVTLQGAIDTAEESLERLTSRLYEAHEAQETQERT